MRPEPVPNPIRPLNRTRSQKLGTKAALTPRIEVKTAPRIKLILLPIKSESQPKNTLKIKYVVEVRNPYVVCSRTLFAATLNVHGSNQNH
jgi:hypothetical protein